MAADSGSPASSIAGPGGTCSWRLCPVTTFVLPSVSPVLKSMASFSVSSKQRAFGAEDGFAVAAEAVAVDRGVLHADLLFRGLRVVGVVAGGGKLENAKHVVFHVAIGREERAAAGGGDVQRICFCPPCTAAMKMLAASSWWLPNSAISPPPVRSHSRQRISSSMAGRS